MAGQNWLYIGAAFLAGVIFSNMVRKTVGPILPAGIEIPSFYSSSYPAAIDYPSTTRSALAGSVYERDYDNANELNINHLPMG